MKIADKQPGSLNRPGFFLKSLLRRNLGGMVYFFLLTFFFFPLQYILEIFSRAGQDAPLYYSAPNLYAPSEIYTGISMFMMTAILFAAPLVVTAAQTHYMHSKKSVDFYHALPLSRRELAVSNGLAAFLTIAIPMALNYGIILIAGSIRAAGDAEFSINVGQIVLDALGWGATHLLIVALMMVISSQVGSTFETLIFSCEFLAAPFLIVLIVEHLMAESLLGYVSRWDLQDYSRLTPLSLMIERFSIDPRSSGGAEALRASNRMIAVWLVLGAVLFALAVYLYKRRKSELAETSGMRGVFGFISKAILVFFGGLVIGGIFRLLEGEGEWDFVFWSILGAALTFLLAEAVFNRGFAGLRKKLPTGAVMVAISAAFSLSLCFGGFGYETRVPAAGTVQSVTVNFRGRFSYTQVMDPDWFTTYETADPHRGQSVTNYRYQTEDNVTLTDPESIELVRRIHTELIRHNQSVDAQADFSAAYDYARLNSIRYQTEAGELSRNYRAWKGMNEETEQLLWELESRPDFIEAACPLFLVPAGQYRSLRVSDRYGLEEGERLTDAAAIEQIAEALKKDILAEDVSAIRENRAQVLGYVYFDTGLYDTLQTEKLTERSACSYSIRVYEGYANTREILEALGLSGPLEADTAGLIAAFQASDYKNSESDGYYQPGGVDIELYSSWIRDPADVAQVLEAAQALPAVQSSNIYYSSEAYLYVRPVTEQEKCGVLLAVPVEEAPQVLLDLFPYYGKEGISVNAVLGETAAQSPQAAEDTEQSWAAEEPLPEQASEAAPAEAAPAA